MTRPEAVGRFLRRGQRRTDERPQPLPDAELVPLAEMAPPLPPVEVLPSCLLVLVSVDCAQAVEAFRDLANPVWRVAELSELDSGDLDEEWERVAVVADSLAAARAAAPLLRRAGVSRRFLVGVVETDRSTVVAPATYIGRTRVVEWRIVRPHRSGKLTVAIRLSAALAADNVVRALTCPPPPRGAAPPAGGLRLGLTAVDAVPWAAGDPAAMRVDDPAELIAPNGAPRFDLLIGPPLQPGDEPTRPRLELGATLTLPPVDVAVVSPWGFRAACGPHGGRLEFDAPGVGEFRVLGEDGAPLVRGDLRIGLTENQVSTLRDVRMVEIGRPDEMDLRPLGRVLSQLACAGVPTRTSVPAELRGPLGAELVERFEGLDDATVADDDLRESWSVSTRRIALRRFTPSLYWARTGPSVGVAAASPPSVDVLLPTRRAAMVPFALAQVERQDWPEVETVLILHGVDAKEEPAASAIAQFGRPLRVVEVSGDVLFGDALNAGTAHGGAALVTKMDDDDWYGPHHLTDLVLAHLHSRATVVGLGGYSVFLSEENKTVRVTRRTEGPTHFLHGGTMLLATDTLRSLGGWRSVPRYVDYHLLQDVETAGGRLYGMHDLGFLYYRGHDHTWTPEVGSDHWLERGHTVRNGFVPPPALDPLMHPGHSS